MKKNDSILSKIKEYKDEFIQGLEVMFKEFFNKETNKKQRANMWTFLRFIIPIITTFLISIAAIIGSLTLVGISAALVGFGGMTDYFDGKSARKHNSHSEFGQKLDQVVDKWFAGILAIDLSILNPAFLLILSGELTIGAINGYYKYKHPECDFKSCMLGRIKQWPLFLTLFLGLLSGFSTVLNASAYVMGSITLLLQAGTAITYVNKYNKTKNNNLNVDVIIDNKIDDIDDNNKQKTSKKVKEKSIQTTISRNQRIEELRNLREEYKPVETKEKEEQEDINIQKVIKP